MKVFKRQKRNLKRVFLKEYIIFEQAFLTQITFPRKFTEKFEEVKSRNSSKVMDIYKVFVTEQDEIYITEDVINISFIKS